MHLEPPALVVVHEARRLHLTSELAHRARLEQHRDPWGWGKSRPAEVRACLKIARPIEMRKVCVMAPSASRVTAKVARDALADTKAVIRARFKKEEVHEKRRHEKATQDLKRRREELEVTYATAGASRASDAPPAAEPPAASPSTTAPPGAPPGAPPPTAPSAEGARGSRRLPCQSTEDQVGQCRRAPRSSSSAQQQLGAAAAPRSSSPAQQQLRE